MGKKVFWLGAAVAAAALIGAFGSIGPDRAAAGGPTTLPACSSADLVPELGTVTINQGLGSYANEKLARGKETLARFYLKLKSVVGTQCSGSINVVNTSSSPTRMTVHDPSTIDDAFVGDLPGTIAPYQTYPSSGHPITASTVQVNSDADPTFVLPASRATACDATPCGFTDPFSLQFKARVYYTTSAGTSNFADFSTMPGTSNPITGNFSKLANDLRILVIPMGDGGQLYSTQFPVEARAAVQSGMDALSRMLPVRAGVSSTLRTTEGGIRYWIDDAAMLNLKTIAGTYPSTKFCGTQQNFDNGIKAKLAWYLQTYNSNPANAQYPADRVLGVVSSTISDGSTSSLGCAEGFGSTNSPESWVRAIPDVAGSRNTPPVPSMTGGLIAHELLHTFGQENVGGQPSLVHSPNTTADGTAPDRGYHLTNRSFIANDRTVLNFVSTSTSPWNNNTTLLELGAFGRALCNLGGSFVSFGCTATNTVGVAPAGAGTGHFVISAVTGGTVATTQVTSSQLLRPQDEALDAHPVLETPCLATPFTYNLAFFGAGPTPTVCHVPTSTPITGGGDVGGTRVTIAGAFPSPGGVTKVQLRKGTDVLHEEILHPSGIEITGVSAAAGSTLEQTHTVTTTPIPPKIDICLDEDESGSFSDDHATLSSLINPDTGTLIPALNETGANYATCVIGYRDFARGPPSGTPWGNAGDWVYRRHADVTAGGGGFQTGVPKLAAGGGGDIPEAQLENLHYLATPSHGAINSNGDFDVDLGQDYTDPEDTPAGQQPTWRSQARRVVLLATDAECHVQGDAGGWPGDTGTASAATTASALAAQNITVIGLIPNTDSPIACVSTLTNGTGGSVHSMGTDGSTLVNAMMAGLGNLEVTVEPSVVCDPGLSLSLYPEGGQTVESGESVSWEQTFTVAEGASGELTCTIEYLVDEVAIDTQTISVPVENTSTTELKVSAQSPVKADMFLECDEGQLPAGDVAIPASDVVGNVSTFEVNADTTNACVKSDGSDPQLSVSFTDGASREIIAIDGSGTANEGGQPATDESPTASIYAPELNYRNPVHKPFALNGQVADPEDGPLTPTWTITGPTGSDLGNGSNVITGISGPFADVPPPPGGWPLGDYTVAITGTDSDGNAADADPNTPGAQPTTATIHVVRYEPSSPGLFQPPIDPLPNVNSGRVGKTYPVKWQLTDQTGAFLNDLGLVAAVRHAQTACAAGAVLDAIETTASGGTALRYDTATNQYVYNWQTPSAVGCYVLSVHFTDGSTYAAYFKLTK